MEVIPLMRSSATGSETSNGGDNGIKRRVQEWSRLDRLTGILEHARVEADQWSNHTANTKHKYGKVVDTRARNLADGSKEQTKQTKQLEVFQAHTGGCSVQVIRSQTSTTSSWHNSNAVAGTFQWPSSIFDKREPQFDELQLEFSPLDVSSQKSKASVARSGSISNRRPPTRRPHVVTTNLPVIDLADSTDNADGSDDHRDHNADTYTTNLSRHKSCSNDEIRSETTESDDFLDRSSRFRRSLQFTQPTDVEESSHKVAGELEDVLKKVLGKKMHVINRETTDDGDNDDGPLLKPSSLLKKPSFVTVESLNKTKNGLRRLDDPGKEDDGIETDAKPAGNTRSLDYRGSALHRTEEWYNRRKSYGFEQMAADHEDKYAAELSAIDSSTDSGICHSTENGLSNSSRQSSTDRESIADLVKKYSNKEINNNNNNSPVQAYSTTVVAKGRILEAINSLRTKSNAYFDTTTPGETTALVLRNNDKRDKQQANGRRLSVDADHVMEKSPNEEESPKRHSIAVVSEVILDRDSSSDKKNVGKKVEFCRTEVHFDTTPGKINIVDMEDKPAPAQAYRPKKRYNRPPEKSNGLPEYHFGEVHGDVQVMMNGHAECNAAEDDDNNKPKSILKQCQQQQQQQQQQAGKEESSGMASDNGIEVRISSTESTPVDYRRASWSVADRVKQVEAVGFSTRVNFTEGETTAVGFDPADPKRYHRYSYNGTGSPVWYQNSGNASDTAAKCHEKLLVRIGASKSGVKPNGDRPAECVLTSASLVMNTELRSEQPSTYTEEMNMKMHGRFQKASSTSWPRCSHKTASSGRKYNLLKTCADIKRERAAGLPDVIGALDDLSKTIDRQIVDGDDRHVTLIRVRQPQDEIRGRLEYVKDLMSTDETSEESMKADEEVRSYMAADCNDEQDCPPFTPECDNNLKKLISTVQQNIKQPFCNKDGFVKQPDAKPYEPSTVPNVTSVLLIHEKQSEPSKFQPVKVHTIQTTVLNRDFDVVLPQKASKRVPVRIVQDNRKEKPKTSAPTIKKSTATVSLKQVPMTVQPKVMCQEQEKKVDKKETVYGNVGYRAGSLRIKDKTSNSRTQDLFNTGRDSWLNMPKDMGPKLNKSKVSTFKQRGRKDTMDLVEASVLEELNRAADEILKAVNGYTDDESQMPTSGDDRRAAKADETKSKNKKRAARLLQRASSREALLHLDEASSSDEEVTDESQRTKPRTQRKTKSQQINNSVATKTTTSFAKKIQSRAQTNSVTKPNNVQHKVHPTYYGNVSNNCTQTTTRFRSRTSDTLTKQSADQKENKAKYQSRITTRVFNPKKSKSSAEENRNRVKGS
ncbi:uncharacterized protein LOC126837856 isoform X1 [Adelges cooleyi]|uniref:uncharacterized protein LOC126837856 isoform X1 n=1 Tax=Adelges cooleyi TaxID=133065 RepID=UPI00217F69B8|nr:uncharacterized protein LOC126837856 isoform X1 [Adelges cooleyi]